MVNGANKNKKKGSAEKPKTEANPKTPIFTEEDRLAVEKRKAECICSRGSTTIRCARCKKLSFGRMFRACPTHPNVVFLYDMRSCPACLSRVEHLEELPIDFEVYQKLVRA